MRKNLILCFVAVAIALPTFGWAGTTNVGFMWTPPVSTTNVIGYRVYKKLSTEASFPPKGAATAICTAPVGTNTCTAPGLPDGAYDFVATSYAANGQESVYSNQVSKVLDTTIPPAPGGLNVTVTVVVNIP